MLCGNKTETLDMTELKALIFDVDGTLADTEKDGHRVAFNLAFEEADLPWSWDIETYGDLLRVTGGKERMVEYANRVNALGNNAEERWEKAVELHKIKTRHYLDTVRNGKLPLRPGVKRLLDEARQAGLRLAIATTTTPENVTELLTATLGKESLDWFEVIAAGDIVPAKKPAPDIYSHTLNLMNLPAEACLALEDSGPGYLSSTGAGIRTLVTVNAYTKNADFGDNATIVSHLGDADNPCEIIAGATTSKGLVDIDYLRTYHAGKQ